MAWLLTLYLIPMVVVFLLYLSKTFFTRRTKPGVQKTVKENFKMKKNVFNFFSFENKTNHMIAYFVRQTEICIMNVACDSVTILNKAYQRCWRDFFQFSCYSSIFKKKAHLFTFIIGFFDHRFWLCVHCLENWLYPFPLKRNKTYKIHEFLLFFFTYTALILKLLNK